MRNIQEYDEKDVGDAILELHRKHLGFDPKTHNFILDLVLGNKVRVITTPKATEPKKVTWLGRLIEWICLKLTSLVLKN